MKTALKILAVPVTLAVSLLVRLCAFLIARTAFLFGLASTALGLLALMVLASGSVKNCLLLLALALAVSPIGLPMLAVKLLGGLQSVNLAAKGKLSD